MQNLVSLSVNLTMLQKQRIIKITLKFRTLNSSCAHQNTLLRKLCACFNVTVFKKCCKACLNVSCRDQVSEKERAVQNRVCVIIEGLGEMRCIFSHTEFEVLQRGKHWARASWSEYPGNLQGSFCERKVVVEMHEAFYGKKEKEIKTLYLILLLSLFWQQTLWTDDYQAKVRRRPGIQFQLYHFSEGLDPSLCLLETGRMQQHSYLEEFTGKT